MAQAPFQPIILEAGRAAKQYWRDLWTYRELLFQLAKRDVSVHYKQTIIGGLWAILRPLTTVFIMFLVFSKVAKLEADGGVWYPAFNMVAVLAWQLFVTVLGESSNSLVANANLVSKVYFPRILVPLSTIGVALVDTLVLLPVAILFVFIAGIIPDWRIVTAPLFLLFAAASAIGFGLTLCSLNVKYRDVRYIIPFILQFGAYLSPVGYSTNRVPELYQWAFHLNPVVFAIDGLRWAFLGVGDPFRGGYWIASVGITLVALYVGIRTFRATERTFADVI
jgi:lipopolysaccharide transport system permease protein